MDPSLPDPYKVEVQKQASAAAAAQRALAAIKRDLGELGIRRLTPNVLQGAKGARIRANVTALARNESVAEGGGALQAGEQKAEEEKILGELFAEGTIEAKEEKQRYNRDRLARVASGRLKWLTPEKSSKN